MPTNFEDFETTDVTEQGENVFDTDSEELDTEQVDSSEDQKADKSDTDESKNDVDPKIEQAFIDGVNGQKDEDSIKIDMISVGCKFKTVTRIYNQLMVKHGLVASKEEKEEAIVKAIKDIDISDEEGLNKAVKYLVENLTNISDKSAAAIIRAYAKKNDIEVYKRPPGPGGSRTDFLPKFYDALVDNPLMTKEEAHDFIVEHGTPNTIRWESSHQKVRDLASRIYKSIVGEATETKQEKPKRGSRRKNGGQEKNADANA